MAYREKLPRTFEKLSLALNKLQESLTLEFESKYGEKDILIEIVVKRFEYTFETLWKTLREILLDEGIECSTPLSAFKQAFKIGLIDTKDEEIYAIMVRKRNEIVHIYSSDDAKEIYLMIKNIFYPSIQNLYTAIKSKLNS